MSRDLAKGYRFGVFIPLFLAGAIFLVAAFSGSFVMSANVYGQAVVSIPAELWASVLFGSSLCYLSFLMINGRWKHSAKLRIASAFMGAVKFAVFAYSAAASAGHDIVVIFGVVFVFAILSCLGIDAREAVLQGRARNGN